MCRIFRTKKKTITEGVEINRFYNQLRLPSCFGIGMEL